MQRKHTKQDRFCREYVKDLNGTRAAIAAGYSPRSAHVTASQLLNQPNVKDKLAKLMEGHARTLDLSAEKVLSELAQMGFANFRDYIGVTEKGDPYIDLSKLTREQAAAIQQITVDEYVEGRGKNGERVKRVRVRLADKTRALELLGRYLRMFAIDVRVNFNVEKIVEKIQAARRRGSIQTEARVVGESEEKPKQLPAASGSTSL